MTRDEYEQWVVLLDDSVIKSWLWLYTKSIRDAERKELIQEVRTQLLRVGAAFRDFQDESDARRYAYGVAAHVGVDWLREHTRASAIHAGVDVHELGDHRHDPERGAIADEELRLVVNAIQMMPKQRRRVVTLVKVYGYSIRETSRRLGIGEKTVKTHLRRARDECVERLLGKKASETTHLLARLLNRIGLGRGRCPSRSRKLIDPTE